MTKVSQDTGMRLLCVFLAFMTLVVPIKAQSASQLRDAYTHAFELSEPIENHDFRLTLQFEEAVIECNRSTAQIYFELVDDKVSGEEWLSRYEPRMTRVRAAIRRGADIISKVRNPKVRKLLGDIHESNLTMLIGYDKVAEGIRRGDEASFNYGIDRIQAGSVRKRLIGVPFVQRLQEKLGREVMEKSFERSIAVVLEEMEKSASR